MAYIPNKLYVGFRADGEDTLTCFMTPLAKDSAFTKRKKTIDDWASKEMNSTEITNEPRDGFRLVDTSRRWNSNNVVFRVIHPEVGAEFEISAENLSNIMSNTDIMKGEIQDKLLLVREGSKNILVIEGSPEHLGSSNVDENGKELFLSKDEYSIGDRISVKGWGECVYFGKSKIQTISIDSKGYNSTNFLLEEKQDEGYVLFFDHNNEVKISTKVPKVLKKMESTGLTIDSVIGAKNGYRETVYDVGEPKGSDVYEYKLIPFTEEWGYALIKNGSNYDIVHKSGNRYTPYGTYVFREDGKFVLITSTTNHMHHSSTGKTFYKINKELK